MFSTSYQPNTVQHCAHSPFAFLLFHEISVQKNKKTNYILKELLQFTFGYTALQGRFTRCD